MLLWDLLQGSYIQYPILPGHNKGEQGKTLLRLQKAVIVTVE